MSQGRIDRRGFLKAAGAVSAGAAGAAMYGPLEGTALAAPAGAATAPALPDAPAPSSWVVRPFANDQVALLPSLFTAHRDRVLNFLRNYPVDNMLFNFRLNAGLPHPGQAPGAWDVADGNLRGHYTGHFMSALALAYAGTGDAFYKDRLDGMVAALGECRDALAAAARLPTGRVAGKFGGAVRLSGCGAANTGHSEHLSLPAGIVRDLGDCTVAAWVNLAARSNASRVFDFGSGSDAHMFLTASEAGVPRFGITTSGSGGEQRINGPAALPTGEWTHLAVTLSAGTGTLYVNGAPVAANGGITLRPSDLGATTANWIGRSQFPQRTVEFLNASVDEFQLWDRALSAAEVQSLTTSAGGTAGGGNVLWYRFDEDQGPTAVDSSGNGRDATIVAPTDGRRHPGYLAAYPETQFIRLEEFCTYSAIWAPYYTNHMIMRGLLDAHLLTGNQQALEIVLGMADWAHSRLARLPRAQLDAMWQTYIGGEYNAMNNLLADLHGLTGDERHLTTARCFDNTAFLQAAAENRDVVDGKHANQHIPQFLGYLNIFDQSGEDGYYAAAANFWDMVVPHRVYTDGGMAGSGEFFGPRDVIAGNIQTANAESCPCYNMLKLSRQLFFHTPDPKYMQYYERALYGHILATRQDADSTTNPLLTYFVPVNPGARRSYGNLGTCCGGTGLESHAKFQDSIYFRSADDSTLYVNLYLASTLRWPERGFTITQATSYPTDPSGTVTLTVDGRGPLDIKLRVPYWVRKGSTVEVNGVAQPVAAVPGSYLTLSRTWSPGDVIDIAMPFSLRVERALDIPAVQSLPYGPILLVIRDPASSYRELGLYRDFRLDGDPGHAITPTGAPMTFTTNGYTLVPFYLNDTSRYHAYFRRSEPEIVFGSVDSGVANRQRSDGLTFLDVVWDQAPFPNRGAFVRTVETVSSSWLQAGLLSRTERERVLTAAARADL